MPGKKIRTPSLLFSERLQIIEIVAARRHWKFPAVKIELLEKIARGNAFVLLRTRSDVRRRKSVATRVNDFTVSCFADLVKAGRDPEITHSKAFKGQFFFKLQFLNGNFFLNCNFKMAIFYKLQFLNGNFFNCNF